MSQQQTNGSTGATVAAARVPFLETARRQAEDLGTPNARALYGRLLEGADTLPPETFYSLSGRLDVEHRCSPAEQARARGRVLVFKKEVQEQKREAARSALGFRGSKGGQTWL